ncbi:hypothetical protein DVU_0696 [Nitratidesulfovibrio vulgaris str. Hildenborough]|uniref:Uncharacterized protein n=1 Tax=Nitratidesulfovibrio vulgaris (strain ATCC 29579 / DSM 644 / CCUG 34227 / NCIMB 8303 / VKM B-1760 / Hildenborough) TaxID=882 RepID=Q72E82_NITV2|nr:hypothetical protein DVU_0696 [Nitratidesulfovibrio vulgaris str. Hildenborough]
MTVGIRHVRKTLPENFDAYLGQMMPEGAQAQPLLQAALRTCF